MTPTVRCCPYHAWTFDTAGTLVSLPGEDGFGPEFDRSAHGLAPVPRTDSYRGFVFGSWSSEGPTLAEHLGEASGLNAYGGVTRDLGGGHGEIDYRMANDRTSIGLGPHGFIFPNLFIESSSIFVIQPVGVAEMIHLQTPITCPLRGMGGSLGRRGDLLGAGQRR